MAITISSLTPLNPTTPAGGFVVFNVSASDSTPGATLTYEWQFSTNGGTTYSSSGLFNNTSSTFQTSNLTINQTGIYFRVKITSSTGEVVNSNEVSSIGDRIVVVTAAPQLISLSQYEYVDSYTLAVGANQELPVFFTIANVDVSQTSALANLTVAWEYSSDSGSTWNTLTNGAVTGTTSYTITTSVKPIPVSSPTIYGVESKLTIVGASFGINNYRYRAKATESSASNSPLVLNSTTVIINPLISIYQQPGDNSLDTQISTNCYKSSIANSGQARFSVGAFTTAGGSLQYAWEFSYLDYNGQYSGYQPVSFGISSNYFRIPSGFTENSDVLYIDRLIYFEAIRFRCIISGFNEEPEVTSDYHEIIMTDVSSVLPSDLLSASIEEDKYGNISDRNLYSDFSIQDATFSSTINTSRSNGLNGKVTMVIQRQNPSSSTWNDITDSTQIFTPSINIFTTSPGVTSTATSLTSTHTTAPLRRNVDDGAKYRVKVTSTAVYTLNSSNQKVLTPIYSTNDALLSVYRTIYITGDVTNISIFPNFNASFSVIAEPSSTATITYQWQYNTTNSTTGWTNITALNAGTLYTGYNTSLLVLANVPSSITNVFYRCILTVPNSLSSKTSAYGKLIFSSDLFSQFTTLNDIYTNEFQPASWTVTAQSLSLGPSTYQWQKSTNYNVNNPLAATWNNISGATNSTYSISSVDSPSDNGYYRCVVTSFGGFIRETNAALLSITTVEIQITKNLPSTLTFLEGIANEFTLEVNALATVGDPPTYQWQYQLPSSSVWNNFITGYQGQLPTGKTFVPNSFDAPTYSGGKIRCVISAPSVPSSVNSVEANIVVNRRFSYFADSAEKNAEIGKPVTIDLQPSVTGGTPSYQWYSSTDNVNYNIMSGQTSSALSFASVSSAQNNVYYKCSVTLANCTQHFYSRNNITYTQSVSTTAFTVPVQLKTVSAPIVPTRYTKETAKSGAAIGTVICIPKPAGYVNNNAATVDDIEQWKCSRTGNPEALVASLGGISHDPGGSSGTFYAANKPSWISNPNWKSPKWIVAEDRFPGFIELRGQWVKVIDFPLLYRVIGNTYGTKTASNGDKLFKLPNPYGKKLMGTGNVNNQSGSTSIIPLYNPDGTSGGDKNVPGSIGGVWNYLESRQLPPGSPGISSKPDGTAGSPDPSTFTIGNYTTNGFTEIEGTATTSFSGSYTFEAGPLIESPFLGPPSHLHLGIVAGYEGGFNADGNGCSQSGLSPDAGTISPSFYAIEGEYDKQVLSGPEGIATSNRGRTHSHGISTTSVSAGNSATNHNTGIGDTTAPSSWTQSFKMEYTAGNVDLNSFNMFLEPAPGTMTNTSKAIFNGALKFTLRNNKPLPLIASYFRLKYMIKAY